MTTVIKKGLLGTNDIKFYSAASPTFYRTTSSGGATSVTAVGATHLPVTTAAASFQFSVNNVNRAVNELGARARAASIRFISTDEVTYRGNKPALGYAKYGSTYVVTCTGSVTVPARVYINEVVYTNTGTVLCDMSRTKTPAAATVGGMDRGPAVATKAYYLYGVPSVSPTATRQWDLMASATCNAMTASATFPYWTLLGALSTNTPVAVPKFSQSGDNFVFYKQNTIMSRGASNIVYNATWLSAYCSSFPTGARKVDIAVKPNRTSAVSNAGWWYYVQDGDYVTNATYEGALSVQVPNWKLSAGLESGYSLTTYGPVKPSTSKKIRHRLGGVSLSAATSSTVGIYLTGFTFGRSDYK